MATRHAQPAVKLHAETAIIQKLTIKRRKKQPFDIDG
jgi:hypothetical protein